MTSLSGLSSGSMIMSRAQAPQRKSFLDLPPEIRTRIYDLVFLREPIYVGTDHYKGTEAGMYMPKKPYNGTLTPSYQSGLPLLQACELVLFEAGSRFYCQNKFTVSESCIHAALPTDVISKASKWLCSLGSHIKFLKTFDLDVNAFLTGASRECHALAYGGMDSSYVDLTDLMHVL